jgi:hypothetical protein
MQIGPELAEAGWRIAFPAWVRGIPMLQVREIEGLNLLPNGNRMPLLLSEEIFFYL